MKFKFQLGFSCQCDYEWRILFLMKKFILCLLLVAGFVQSNVQAMNKQKK